MAICYADEGGLRHLHLDILSITAEGKLSAKTLITRDFITSIHKLMPIILRNHGFDIDEYEETAEHKKGGISAKEYKKAMDEESRQINKRLDDMIKEYNDLAEKYNKLIQDKKELERKNKEKALAVLYPERTR